MDTGENKKEHFKLVTEIPDNTNFEHDGSVYVQGNIGGNARVVVKNGTLHVTGSVGANTTITQNSDWTKNTKVNTSLSSTYQQSASLHNGIKIEGADNGSNITLLSDSSVNICNTEHSFTVNAASLNAHTVGERSNIQVQELCAYIIGDKSKYVCEEANIYHVGKYVDGHSILNTSVHSVDAGANIDAGLKMEALAIHEDATVKGQTSTLGHVDLKSLSGYQPQELDI